MDIDVTFFMQLGLVTMVIFVLRPMLATPLMRVMEDRHQQTHGARADARRMERLTALDKEAYQARSAKARHEMHRRREAQRQQGRDTARSIEDGARKEAAQIIIMQRASLKDAQKAAKQTLHKETAKRAQKLASRLLGREVRQ